MDVISCHVMFSALGKLQALQYCKRPRRCFCYDMTLMICPVSGFIHEHRDRYIAQSGSLCGQRLQPVAVLLDFSKAAGDDAHLRANIVVQIEELEPRRPQPPTLK